MKHSNAYLYGDEVEVPDIPADVIARRLAALSDNLEELLNHSYYDRDQTRVNAVLKAITFWETIQEN